MVWCAVFCTVLVSEACLRISQYLSLLKYSVTLNAFVMLNDCNDNNVRFIFIFFHTVVCTRNAFERIFFLLFSKLVIFFVNFIVNMFCFLAWVSLSYFTHIVIAVVILVFFYLFFFVHVSWLVFIITTGVASFISSILLIFLLSLLSSLW